MNVVVYSVAAAALVASAGPAVLGHAAAATGESADFGNACL
jgi:hypothetical protein